MSADQLYDDLLDALYATFGTHPGFRVAHAKGLLVNGTFIASAAARSISKAVVFQQQPVSVMMRFSNFSGVPATADGDPMASPYGLALRFQMPDGVFTDIVAHSFDGFPVATPQDFLSFLQGIAASAATPSDPALLNAFIANHPRAGHFLDAPKPKPRSYALVRYFGVNSLRFTNTQGTSHFGRYRIEPMIAEPPLTEAETVAMPVDYLGLELEKRVKNCNVQMRLVVQLAASHDVIDDGSISWPSIGPEARQEVLMGVITLNTFLVTHNQQPEQERLDFNPGRLLEGIASSGDPMIKARQGIYERSFERRKKLTRNSEHSQ